MTPTQNVPVIDRDELIERMMGSVALADRMLNRFLDTADADCDLMESTVRLGDKAAIVSAAHRHKGTAQTLAAPRVARLAGELEQRAHSESTAELLAMVDQLRTLHQEIRNFVQDGVADCEPASGGARS
jgi:HPt (histidine-containing phosphotransfer) domain-containing protein